MTWLKTKNYMVLTFWRLRFGKFTYANLITNKEVTRYWLGCIVFETEKGREK